MKLLTLLLSLLMAIPALAAPITTDQVYRLNHFMGKTAFDVSLGTLIQNAGTGSSLANGKFWVGNGSGASVAVTPTGDVTFNNAGVFNLTAGAILNADVNAAAAIDFSKLATLTSGNILVGSAGNVATSVTPSGDVTISNTGVTALGSNKVLNANIDPTVVKWQDTTITTGQMLALFDTPITLVAAPASGLVNIVRAVYSTMTYNSVAYVCNAAGLIVKYTNGSGATAATLSQTYCQSAASAIAYVADSSTMMTPVAAAALVLHAGTANPTTGNSGLKVRVYYTQAPSPLP